MSKGLKKRRELPLRIGPASCYSDPKGAELAGAFILVVIALLGLAWLAKWYFH